MLRVACSSSLEKVINSPCRLGLEFNSRLLGRLPNHGVENCIDVVELTIFEIVADVFEIPDGKLSHHYFLLFVFEGVLGRNADPTEDLY